MLPVDEGRGVRPHEPDGEDDDERVGEEGEEVVADALEQQPDHGHPRQYAPGCLLVPPQHKIGS